MDFYQFLDLLNQTGTYDILLPFILIFTISFAVLQKIKLFGDKSKNINVVVALVVSFFFLNNAYLVFILQKFLPGVSISLIVGVMFLLLIGLFAGGTPKFKGMSLGIAAMISLGVIFVAVFTDFFLPFDTLTGSGGLAAWFGAISPQDRFLFWMLIIVVVIVFFVLGGDDDNNKDNFFEKLGKSFET